MLNNWEKDNKWEQGWWGDCTNTLREEFLQFAYAKRMGLETYQNDRSPYNIETHGRSIIDIGGGPVSMLLKTRGGVRTVIDPCPFPQWVYMRYAEARINYQIVKAEDFVVYDHPYDEAWIYNVLQHTVNPKIVIDNARESARLIRIFEWIDAGISPGHPHELTEEKLNEWLHGKGTIENINEHGAIGKCYYGVFNVISK